MTGRPPDRMTAPPADERPPEAAAAALARAATVLADRSTAARVDAGGWPMADDAVRLLAALVAELEPAHVVEFGSGGSTVALARAVADLDPPGRVTALENDPVIRRRTLAALRDADLSAHAVVHFAPLVVRRVDGRHLPVYHLQRRRFASSAPPDIVVVDGPPSMLGGREGAVRQALHLAAVGSLILLDDADRPHESQVLEDVTHRHGAGLQRLPAPGFTRGLAAFVVTAPIQVRMGSDTNPSSNGITTNVS